VPRRPRRFPLIRLGQAWSRAVLAVSALAVLAPAVATAAPLSETEPNDDALHANGPFGPDGWTQTINVGDDVDYVLFRLQGQRQVSLTSTGLTSCNYGYNYFVFASADGRLTSSSGIDATPRTVTWTTPRDATEYVGHVSAIMGCSGLIKITPADALITGPLPAPSYPRSLAVAAPAQVEQAVPVPVTATGVAADDDEVQAQWRTGGCPAAPDASSGGRIVSGAALAAGAFNVTLATTSPSTAGTATLCTWLVDTLGKLDPLLRQQTVVVTAPPVDHDGDGVVAGPDCNDNDPAIKPGAAEIPGNKVDENCDGLAAPYPRVPATVTLGATPLHAGQTRIRSLVVRQTSSADAIRVTCTGGGCRRSLKRLSITGRSSGTLSLTARVNGMRLRTGATLSVRISRTGFQSRVFKYSMHRHAQPSLGVRCANPGVTATFAC
jgi:hypothetical protein